MNKKSQQLKISTRLSQLSKKLNVPYLNVLTEFLLEGLAIKISSSTAFSDLMIFKGGFVSVKVYHSPRYTVDLDALLKKGNMEKLKPKLIALIEADVGDGIWFQFEKEVNLETQGEYGGTRLVFRAGLGEKMLDVKRAKIIQLDIGHGDPITPGPLLVNTQYLIGDGSFSWKVYPIETTVAEKLHALIERKSENSRSKDIFDLSIFLSKCDHKILKMALVQTFKYRESILPKDIHATLSEIDLTLLRRGWKSAVEDIENALSCDEAFDIILEYFK